jgi:hypothetical protein
MDTRNGFVSTAKADFYRTLARSFLAPVAGDAAAAMLCGELANKLTDLDQQIDYGIGPELDACQRALDAVGYPEDLQLLYAQSFLVPPRRRRIDMVPLLDGDHLRELEACHAGADVTVAAKLPVLVDYLAGQLAFLSSLYAENARVPTPGRFIERYPARLVPALIADINAAGFRFDLEANPYLHLARILQIAFEFDGEGRDSPSPPTVHRERGMGNAKDWR